MKASIVKMKDDSSKCILSSDFAVVGDVFGDLCSKESALKIVTELQ